MTIFHAIQYPIVDWIQMNDTFKELPEGIRRKFQTWQCQSDPIARQTQQQYMAKLRQIILDYDE